MNVYLKLLQDKRHTVKKHLNLGISHRDYYDKQVIFSKKKVTLIDCDNMAMADPALDYGNFIGHLILRRLQYPQATGYINDGLRAFNDAYRYSDEGFIDRAKWWASATLLRILTLYILRPKWQGAIPGILDEMRKIWQEQSVPGGVDEM
jgi:thiamine kinase-like enzyme